MLKTGAERPSSHEERLPIEVLILAGGSSSRMGIPKTQILWEGVPLWLSIARKAAAFAVQVRIVGLSQTEFPMIADPLRIGPLGGILLGLEQIQTPQALVIACDMPFWTADAVKELFHVSQDHDVVIPRAPDGLHPLFALYGRSCIEPIRERLDHGARQIRSFFPNVRVHEFAVETSDSDWNNILFNINTPSDLAQALQFNGKRFNPLD